MPRARERITQGVYRDQFGVAIIVSVRGKPREFRHEIIHGKRGPKYREDATHGPAWFRDERKRVQARERLKAECIAEQGETFRADVQQFLKTFTGRQKRDATNLLGFWLSTFGDRIRHSITAIEYREEAATWTCAASTFNHRRQALINLYTALDGPRAPNPAREIPKMQEILGAPKALSYAVIEAIFAQMPDTPSRARLKLMAYAGLPQMQITKLTPEDWQQDRLRVSPRRKGAGAAGRWIPLSAEAQAAMEEFSRLNCWGNFSGPSMRNFWLRFAPKGTRPYDLRHSWITELYRRSNGDVIAVQQLALHSRLEQTQRYAAAALEDRMDALVRGTATTTSPNRSRNGQKRPHRMRGKRRQKRTRNR